MSRLWVPPKTADRLKDGTREHNTHVLSMLYLEGGILDEWNRELARMDPYLRLAQASPQATEPVAAGYYHLVRLNPGAPITVQPITGPSGEFVEPGSELLDQLRAMDLQNVAVRVARLEAEKKAEQTKRRADALEEEQRQDDLAERWAAATETRISMTDAAPWSQNVAGRRGRKKVA